MGAKVITGEIPLTRSDNRPVLVRNPGFGLLVFIIGAAIMGVLTYNVLHNGPLTKFDQPLAQALHYDARNGPWPILLLMWGFSALGQAGIMMFMLLLAIVWAVHHHWRNIAMILFGVGGGEALFQLIGGMVNRHRPVFPDPLEKLPGPGFPSGHTTTSVLLFGLMLYLLWRRLPSNTWRVIGLLIVIAIVNLIGFARMYIGDHYLTDILAGEATGLAWFGLIYTTIELVAWGWHQRRRTAKKHDVSLNRV